MSNPRTGLMNTDLQQQIYSDWIQKYTNISKYMYRSQYVIPVKLNHHKIFQVPENKLELSRLTQLPNIVFRRTPDDGAIAVFQVNSDETMITRLAIFYKMFVWQSAAITGPFETLVVLAALNQLTWEEFLKTLVVKTIGKCCQKIMLYKYIR